MNQVCSLLSTLVSVLISETETKMHLRSGSFFFLSFFLDCNEWQTCYLRRIIDAEAKCLLYPGAIPRVVFKVHFLYSTKSILVQNTAQQPQNFPVDVKAKSLQVKVLLGFDRFISSCFDFLFW